MKPIIRVERLSKQYRVGVGRPYYGSLRESLANMARAPWKRRRYNDGDQIWAIRDVSFDVMPGEVVGIIGRNGAGKSTLLKILSRITAPTTGRVDLHGRLGSLLEVGCGFHPELTGRENIYLNGAILGMHKTEIDRKFDEIVAFAEIESFLDTPVKRYSSGMYLRLAFGVAANLEPEILVVDEILAVGDTQFQKKCLGRMQDVAGQGRTVLFVSHNMAAVAGLCTRAMLLETGRISRTGDVGDVIDAYVAQANTLSRFPLRARKDRVGRGPIRLAAVNLVDRDGQPLDDAISGQEVGLQLAYEHAEAVRSARFKMTVYNHVGQALLHFDSQLGGVHYGDLPPSASVTCWIGRLPLSAGLYRVNVSVNAPGEILDHVSDALTFRVSPGDYYGTGRAPEGLTGICLAEQTWLPPRTPALQG